MRVWAEKGRDRGNEEMGPEIEKKVMENNV